MPEAAVKAGGGAGAKQRAITVVDEHVLTHLRTIYNAHASANPDKKWTSTDIASFLTNIQGHDPSETLHPQTGDFDFNQFLEYMTSPRSKITKDPPPTDLSWPLSSYFISSSHNTYLSGNQLSSDSTTESYTNVLLRGCRCVEVDVWDGDDSDSDMSSSDEEERARASSLRKKESQKGGLSRFSSIKKRLPGSLSARLEKTSIGKRLEDREAKKEGAAAVNDEAETTAPRASMQEDVLEVAVVEPRVLHGYTLTKEITFRDVCVAIRDSAFQVTDTPLIVSLEVHCSPAQQAIMVSIIKEIWADYLVPEPESEPDVLPSPEQLKSKILVKVKFAAPGSSPERSESGGDDDDDRLPAEDKKNKKPSKIIQELSRLGVYTRGISFKDFTQPEATMPTHIFSLSEKKFLDNHENRSVELWEHNKRYLMRTYPKGTRITSSNLNPAPFWGSGSQVVALNWQQVDEGTMLNEGMFAGTGGYVLKPEGYRQDLPDRPQKAIATKTLKSLSITFLAAQRIPIPADDKSAKGFEPYVKVELHVDGSEGQRGGHIANGGHEREGEYKARTKTHEGVNIDLKGEVVKFSEISGLVEELTFVRFTVRDDEIVRDDLAAWCCVRLDRLGEGYRFVHLLNSKADLTEGVILVKVEKTMV
ncbi:phosphatidyl inositol-specific phospholipase C [Emericellopsis atlantica]|uniref:Phosphoinositide phospholipase C n=1 Tax=Emericellopsis atlantica TaxID=2614577 RepID=A0A9P7ZT84_9HYPO|nr:phosphatidyl inositol-specific phospholipase C [Emericellopsis atlantica]KAG9257255.1 phosphatidyl inositol-specific phospholipase C [Emericellopsis atlantica]